MQFFNYSVLLSRKGLDPHLSVDLNLFHSNRVVGLGVLLQFYLCAYLFESFLQSLCSSFVNAFLNVRRSCIYDVLSLFQTKTGLLFNGFYNLELVSTCALQNYVERGLLLYSLCCCTSSRSSCNSYSSSCRLNSVLLFEDSSEFIYFLNGKVN